MIEKVTIRTQEDHLVHHTPDHSHGSSAELSIECRRTLSESQQDGSVILSHRDTTTQRTTQWDARRE